MHGQPVNALAQDTGVIGLGVRGERLAAQVRVARRGDAQCRQPLPGAPHDPRPRGRVHVREVVAEPVPEHPEHRPFEQHAGEPPLAVAADHAVRRVRLAVGEPGLPQRRRVEHARVQ